MSFLNGDLDQVFTVLYEMGRIEPLLQKDWKKLFLKSREQWEEMSSVISALNEIRKKEEIRNFLNELPPHILESLVVEVARELAAFYDRKESVH